MQQKTFLKLLCSTMLVATGVFVSGFVMPPSPSTMYMVLKITASFAVAVGGMMMLKSACRDIFVGTPEGLDSLLSERKYQVEWASLHTRSGSYRLLLRDGKTQNIRFVEAIRLDVDSNIRIGSTVVLETRPDWGDNERNRLYLSVTHMVKMNIVV